MSPQKDPCGLRQKMRRTHCHHHHRHFLRPCKITKKMCLSNVKYTPLHSLNIVILGYTGSVSPSHFYYGAAPCPFSPAPCPFSESTFCALHFGKKFVKIGQKIRKLQDLLLEVCRNKFGKIYNHDFHSC